MTAGERGFLLLSSRLGNPDRKCLTTAQFRLLAERVRNAAPETEPREMTPEDLVRLGYPTEQAVRIWTLLHQEALLECYLRRCEKAGCGVLTRISEGYPHRLRIRMGLDAPACLWYRGDVSILHSPRVSLVGSRDIQPENAAFAREAGRQAALQGYTLVSGNARGADRMAQQACLESGGKVICVLADPLTAHPAKDRVLYLSEDGFDMEFSTLRALSRNRVIHALGCVTLVAQSALHTGGTWDGTVRNLRQGWSNVACFDDGSKSAHSLAQMGADLISTEQLVDFSRLAQQELSLFSNNHGASNCDRGGRGDW